MVQAHVGLAFLTAEETNLHATEIDPNSIDRLPLASDEFRRCWSVIHRTSVCGSVRVNSLCIGLLSTIIFRRCPLLYRVSAVNRQGDHVGFKQSFGCSHRNLSIRYSRPNLVQHSNWLIFCLGLSCKAVHGAPDQLWRHQRDEQTRYD